MKQRVIFAILMSFVLSILMTCWVTWINLGWTEQFYSQWFNAFILAWPAAALISFFVGPEAHKLSVKLAE